MNLEQFSILLSVGLIVISVVTIASFLAYVFVPKLRTQLCTIEYELYLKTIGLLAVTSTLMVLVYQFYYLTPVCAYCWWQRIFMFPIDIVILVALWYKTKHSEVTTGILAAFGTFFAGYHYYYHYQVIVLDNPLAMPCSSIGILPSCTDSPVLVFEFITIPLMALVVFVSILWLSFLARKTS